MRPHHFRLLFELIGRQDIADDPDLQSHNDRIKNAPKIIKALQETMPTKTTEEWIAILQPKDVFCERVNNYTDYLEHPHVKESGAIDWIEEDGVRPPCRSPTSLACRPPPSMTPQQHAPHVGEDGPDILGELGYSAAEIDAHLHPRRRAPAPATDAGQGGRVDRRSPAQASRSVVMTASSGAAFPARAVLRSPETRTVPCAKGSRSSTKMVLMPCWRAQPAIDGHDGVVVADLRRAPRRGRRTASR